MAIDNPIDAFKKLHPDEEENLPKDLAVLVTKLALPGFIGTILGAAYERLGRKAQAERANETLELLLNELKHLQGLTATKVEVNDLKESLQLAIRHDVEEFNDNKRDRYVKIIGNALRSETLIEDLASFIQDVEQLGERDFIALKVLNKVMNKVEDWSPLATTKLHPNTFIQRRQELAVQMAQAFGMKTDWVPRARHSVTKKATRHVPACKDSVWHTRLIRARVKYQWATIVSAHLSAVCCCSS